VLSEDEKKGNQEHMLEKEDFKPGALEDERETEVEVENKIYCESGDANEKLDINDVEESNSDRDSQSGVEFEIRVTLPLVILKVVNLVLTVAMRKRN